MRGNTAASHELLHALGLCAGVIVAVALKQIDCTPDAKTCAQSDNESLKNGYCAIEKCHNIFLLKFEIVLRIEKALRTTGIKTRTEGLVYENLFKELLDGYHAKFLFHSASCIFSFTIIYITTTFHKKQPIH